MRVGSAGQRATRLQLAFRGSSAGSNSQTVRQHRRGPGKRRLAHAAKGTPDTNQPSNNGNEVQEALERAQRAAQDAEAALEDVPNLPSASLWRTRLLKFFRIAVLASVALTSGTLAGTEVLFNQSANLYRRVCVAVVLAGAIALGGYSKRSLSMSGAVAAFFVGLSTLASSYAMGGVLVAFFVSSSLLTRAAALVKAKLDADFKEGGQRDWVQVACNGAVPSLLALAFCWMVSGGYVPFLCESSASVGAITLQAAVLGYYGCCCGDTWASEVGVLSKGVPRLIISGRPVRKGTNGAVSALGLVVSAAGGLCMGAVAAGFAIAGSEKSVPSNHALMLVGMGTLAGFLGSVIDSVLGALLQFSGYNTELQKVVNKPGKGVHKIAGFDVLTNNQVNLLSASLTSSLSAMFAMSVLCPAYGIVI